MLAQAGQPSARRAVHLLFSGERVRPDYPSPVPELGAAETLRGVRLIPLADLVAMKLTSFRLKDQMHLKDLDEQGLIGPEMEAGLPPVLRGRLAEVRARD